MNTVLYVTLEVVRQVALLLQPVMPDSTAKLLTLLGVPEGESRQFAALGTALVPGTELPTRTGVPALRSTQGVTVRLPEQQRLAREIAP